MTDFPTKYRAFTNSLGARPDAARDWKWLLVLALIVYCFSFGVRLLDVPRWLHPGLQVQGEYIAGTHDAYAWMAGAEGVGDYVDYPFSRLTGALGGLTGAKLGNVAFWAPAVLASLVAPATLLWGWLLAGRTAGLAAGLLGAVLPGFYVRSRVGYWDTDVFTLLMPLLTAWFLAVLLKPRLEAPAREASGEPEEGRWRPWLALGFGILARTGGWWHLDVLNVNLLAFGLAVAAVLVFGGRQRARGLRELLIFGIAAFGAWGPWYHVVYHLGWIALAALLAAASFLPGPQRRVLDNFWVVAGLTAAFLAFIAQTPILLLLSKFAVYFNPSAPAGDAAQAGGGPVYPAIIQSIRETRLLDVTDYLGRMGGTVWAGVLGTACFLFVLAVRPEAVLLLPLLGIGLAGFKLGARFGMFGGPCVVLALGVCTDWLVRRFFPDGLKTSLLALCSQAALALFIVWPLADGYKDMPPTPVLDKIHAESLIAIKDLSPADAGVWTWWDYGYAAQYYARRMTPADGGKHAGRDVYPLALALTTDSYRQANQIIRYAASKGYDPAAAWDAMPAGEVRDLVQGLAERDAGIAPTPPQYLVVTWENLNLAYWITYFGSWDVAGGTAAAAQTLRPRGFEVDSRRGGIAVRETGQVIALSSMEVASAKGARKQVFSGNTGPHLVINPDRADAYVLDDRAYNSMMVRLLLGDPQDPALTPFFKLAVDRYPHVRVYEVVQ